MHVLLPKLSPLNFFFFFFLAFCSVYMDDVNAIFFSSGSLSLDTGGGDDSSSFPRSDYNEEEFGFLQFADSELTELQFCQSALFAGCSVGELHFEMPELSKISTMMETMDHQFIEEFFEQQPVSEDFFALDQSQTSSLQSRNLISASLNDDLAITRALTAVISSSSSSSLSSSPSSVLYQQSQSEFRGFSAFRPFESGPPPNFDPKSKKCCGQEMIKTSMSLFRKIDSMMDRSQTRQPLPTSVKLQHIKSERKRREKLNESFKTLHSLLLQGSKKDKASVLSNTRNYLKGLNTEISKLEKENKMLEMDLRSTDGNKEIVGLTEKIKVRIINGSKLGMESEVSARVGVDMIELVLCMLEYLKGLRGTSLVSLDANTGSRKSGVSDHPTITVQIKASDCDEEQLEEAMRKAVEGARVTP